MYVLFVFLLIFGGSSEEDASGGSVLLNSCITSYMPFAGFDTCVKSAVPLTWLEMQQLCWSEQPGLFLSKKVDLVARCPDDSLVPLGIVKVDGAFWWYGFGGREKRLTQDDFINLESPDLNVSGEWGALRRSTSELVIVGNETKFTCAVCSMEKRLDVLSKGFFPAHNNSDYKYDLELVSNDQIDDLSSVADCSERINKLLGDLAKVFDILVTSLRWHGAELNGDNKAVVHVFYDRGDVDMGWLDYLNWYDQDFERKEVDGFTLTLIKLNTECLVNKKISQHGVRSKPILTGFINSTYGTDMNQVTIQECFWNSTPGVESAAWSRPYTLVVVWDECRDGNGIASQLLSLSGPEFEVARKIFDFQIGNIFSESERKHLMDYLHNNLKTLVFLINLLMMAHTKTTKGTIFSILSNSMIDNVAKVYILLPMHPGNRTIMVHSKFVNVLSSDQVSTNPVVGLALSLAGETSDANPSLTQLNQTDVSSRLTDAHIILTVSKSIYSSAKRLVFATYAAHLDFPNLTYTYDDSVDSWMALVQITFTRNETWTSGSKDDFFDIAFKPVFRLTTQRGKCAERVFATNEWYGGNCRVLKSLRNKLLVCRCQNLPGDGISKSGTYLIYGSDASLSTFFAENLTLVIVMIFVSITSALGLISVIATAVYFPNWRKDQGHQIFLQMVLALAVNLALGFVNNFISVDTKSAACIAIGVARHYSFLAMFVWMMILSGLQVKRLTTISGSKTITHLILKVSAIAWGVPLIPIIILLSWDTGFYKSDVSNRGYCYPEDFAFQATVQGPAGLILVLNLVIFVIVLNHIYGWVKCNSDIEVRKHTTDDRCVQLRNFGNSVFVFFLFGFTWLFHFLAEEGIINSEFLFEFLFLITASFHLFMLSLFFILLDKKTRTLWLSTFNRRKRVEGH